MSALIDLARQPNIGWSIGVYGAVAEFITRNATLPEIEIGDGSLTLRTSGGTLQLRPPPGTRMFEFVDATGSSERHMLALHRSRLRAVPASGVTELGADEEAIGSAQRTERLFDLGVTRSTIRFCVRTGDASLIAALRRANGLDAFNPAIRLVPALLASSPDRVVISPIGRIEVFGPIVRSDPGGPHTHLLPQLLALGNELKPGLALPEGYVAGASIFSVAGTATAPACEYRAPENRAAGSSLRDELRSGAPAIRR
jgi:hypothetical protein